MTAFHSPHWFRVADLTPRLRHHTTVSHHRYQRRSWYVMHDRATGKVHRFTPAAYAFVKALDGKSTVDEIWRRLAVDLAVDAPSQHDIVTLLVELHEADILQGHRPPDAAELHHHVARQRRTPWINALKNPLSVTIPLWDPDALLTRHQWVARLLFHGGSLLLWCLLVLPALFLAAAYSADLFETARTELLSGSGLLVTGLVFPVMKFFHEAGHALAVKAYGGSVHRTGLIIIGIFPIPYVDASTAATFPRKGERIVVGAAGMAAELAIAAVALYTWIVVEPGLIRDIAFSTIAVATISIAIVNGNPLLRFDGYFILCDLIEMPNLAQRSTRYWGQRLSRVFANVQDQTPQHTTGLERAWFIAYGPLASVYRVVVLLGLSIWIATEYLAVGVVLASVALFSSLVLPSVKGVRHLLRQADGQGKLSSAYWRLTTVMLVFASFLAFVPVPMSTLSEGVVALPETAYLRAAADGFVHQVHAPFGSRVEPGHAILTKDNITLTSEVRIARIRMDELTARYTAEQFADRVAAEITRAQLDEVRQQLELAENRVVRLVATSQQLGEFVATSTRDLADRFFAKGETIGIVSPNVATRIHALVGQEDIELVRSRLQTVNVLAISDLTTPRQARIVREVPAAGFDLPSHALTVAGGGQLPTRDATSGGAPAKSTQRVFLIELDLEDPLPPRIFGGRVYVRFEHQPEPLIFRGYRRIRQLLLSNFHA